VAQLLCRVVRSRPGNAFLCWVVCAGLANAQNFPVKPVRLVASTMPGSQPDGIARMLANEMSEQWGKPVVVDNRPAANGVLAAAAVAKATPDGHTLLYVLPQFQISSATKLALPYDPRKDFAAVAQMGYSTNLLVAGAHAGVKSVRELIAAARAQPGKLVFGTGATGTLAHLVGARFNNAAGIKVIQVAFKGGPEAAVELLAGRSHYTLGTMGVLLPYVRDGRIVAIATANPKRSAVLPDVPSLAETFAEFKRTETSHGFVVPASTPRAVLEVISREVARDLALPELKEKLIAIGFEPAHAGPDEYARILRGQLDGIVKLVVDAGLRPR
jgi:tripartite-type tricarboxylate transporter receptor subunit TctC